MKAEDVTEFGILRHMRRIADPWLNCSEKSHPEKCRMCWVSKQESCGICLVSERFDVRDSQTCYPGT